MTFPRLSAFLLCLTAASVCPLEKRTATDCPKPQDQGSTSHTASPCFPVPDPYLRRLDLDKYSSVQGRAHQDPSLTLVVAISGGGLRAANFALGSLLALERIPYGDNSNLHNEIDYFSTVSGGGLAAAASTVARIRARKSDQTFPLRASVRPDGSTLLANMRQRLGRSLALAAFRPTVFLGPQTRADNLQLLLDRTLLCPLVDQSACQSIEPHKRLTLGHIFAKPERQPTLPYWYINATDLSTGEIIPFSPQLLARAQVRGYWHETNILIEKNQDYYDVPLALALRSSMNFPLLMPATRLERNGRNDFLYLTDGGESDNLGIVTATTIFSQERERPSRNQRRLLIIIDAHQGVPTGQYCRKPRAPNVVESLFRATTLPLDAHRFRVRQDYDHADANQLSVMDALSKASDLAVAYVDLTSEEDASSVSTFSIPNRDVQRDLICAGIRSTLRALGVDAALMSDIDFDGQICTDQTQPKSPETGWVPSNRQANVDCTNRKSLERSPRSGILVFNRQAKDEFAIQLLDEFHSARVIAMKEVDKLIGEAREASLDALWRRERDGIDVYFDLSPKVDILLGSEQIDRMISYRKMFTDLFEEIKDERNEANDVVDTNKENHATENDEAEGREAGLLVNIKRLAAAVLAFFGVYPGTESEPDTTTSPDGAVRAQSDDVPSPPLAEDAGGDAVRAVLGILAEIVEEAEGAETIISDGRIEGVDEFDSVVAGLNSLQRKQVGIFRGLDGQPRSIPKSVSSAIAEVQEALSIPAGLVSVLEKGRRENTSSLLRERGKEYADRYREAWRVARETVRKELEIHEISSNAYHRLQATWSRLQKAGRVDPRKEHGVCEMLEYDEAWVGSVLDEFPSEIDFAEEGILAEQPTDDVFDTLSESLKGAREAIELLVELAQRNTCLYPDRDKRDEMPYGLFLSGKAVFDATAECGDSLPYRRACATE